MISNVFMLYIHASVCVCICTGADPCKDRGSQLTLSILPNLRGRPGSGPLKVLAALANCRRMLDKCLNEKWAGQDMFVRVLVSAR